MAGSGIEDKISKEILRESLTDGKLRDFKGFRVIGQPWNSHHAVFNRVALQVKTGEEIGIIVKRFVHPKHTSDPFYSLMHDPSFLYTKEKTNLKLINECVSFGDEKDKDSEIQLVPVMYGYNDTLHMIFTEDLGRQNMNKLLLANGDKRKSDKFEKGIKIIGRFVGKCSRYQSKLDALGGYEKSIDSQEKYMLAIQTENLLRLFYNINQECRNIVGEYDSGKVREFLAARGSSLESRLKEIAEIRKRGLQEELRLQHNDCNGLNIVKGRLVDLEDFGYNSWTTDISSYCIIVGLGNNAILREDLTHYRHLYLAYEYVYGCANPGISIAKVSKLDNGDLGRFVREEVFQSNEQRYADWTFSFFAGAIDKNVQLAATFGRYADRSFDNKAVSQLDIKTLAYIAELFSTVARIDEKITLCSGSKEVREFFCAYGNLLLNLDIYSKDSRERPLLEDSIKKIDQGIIAEDIKKYWAFPSPQPSPVKKA